jgi:hypothetical protein
MVTETQRRIRAMEMQKQQLSFRANKLETQAREEFQQGRKQRAVELVKQQRQLEQQIKMTDGQIFNLNQQVLALQSASGNVEMAKLMRSGATSMQQLVQEVEDLNIEDVADDLRDAMDESHEVGRVLSEPMIRDTMDDDDILAQMDGWAQDTTNGGGGGKVHVDEPNLVDSMPSVETYHPVPTPVNKPVGLK